MTQQPSLIDIESVLKKRGKKWYRIMPRFMIEHLKRIVHEEDINKFLTLSSHMRGEEFFDTYHKYYGMQYKAIGLEHVPKGPRYIFVANHPIGSHDGVLIIELVETHFGPSLSMINDLLLNVVPLRPYGIGVNKQGTTAKDSVRIIDEAFRSDKHMIIFPAGLVSRRTNGVIADPEWQRTFVKRAQRYKIDVVPVHISGRNSNFFYNLANLRKKLGIKTNFEMLYLADELYNNRNQTLEFTFGKPIPYTTFDKSRSHSEWATRVRQLVYRLPNNPGLAFDPNEQP